MQKQYSYLLAAFLFFSANEVFAKDQCSLKQLTNNCQIFATDSPEIKLDDGTSIPNLPYLFKKNQKSNSDDSAAKANSDSGQEGTDNDAKDLKIRLSAMTILDQKRYDSKLSPATKLLLASDSVLLAKIFVPEANAADATNINIPSPPESSSIKSVTTYAARAAMKAIFDPSDFDQLTELGKQAQELSAARSSAGALGANTADRKYFERMTKVSPERVKKVYDLVEQARASDIHAIVGDKPESTWSLAEIAAVQRLRDIQVTPFDNADLVKSPQCLNAVGQAFYDPDEQSINVCPNLYNYPDATIIGILGHEMGHAMDPCNSQFASLKLDLTKIRTYLHSGTDGGYPAEILDPAKNDIFKSLYALSFDHNNFSSQRIGFNLSHGKEVTDFLSSRQFAQTSGAGIPFNKYVLSDVFSCLTSPKGGSFRSVTDDTLKYYSEKTVDLLLSKAGDPPLGKTPEQRRQKMIKDMLDKFHEFPECVSPDEASQMQEAVADWFGSQAVGDFLKKNPPKNQNDRIASVSFFAAVACGDEQMSDVDLSTLPVSDVADLAMSSSFAARLDPHPPSIHRVESIFMHNTAVQDALACSAPAGCEHHPDKPWVHIGSGGGVGVDQPKNSKQNGDAR